MRAAVLLGNRQVEVREMPIPEVGDNEVLIANRVSAICGSDMHFYRQRPEELGGRVGAIVGHEASGVVAAVGRRVRGLREGDRVSVYHVVGCGRCRWCLAGEIAMCQDSKGMAAIGRGANAEYIAMSEQNCVPLPSELSFVDGAFIACIAATAYNALRKLGASGRQRLVVCGLGPVGLTAVRMASRMGAPVFGIDITTERLQLAMDLGADAVASARAESPIDAIRAWTGGLGTELAIETSGAAVARAQLIDAMANGGRIAFLGISDGNKEGTYLDVEKMIARQLTIFGSAVMPIHLSWELTEFLVREQVNLSNIVTHRFPIDSAPEAFALFDQGKTGKVLFSWDETVNARSLSGAA